MNREPPANCTSPWQKAGWTTVLLVIGLSVYAAFSQPPAVASDVGTYLLANATNSARHPTILTSVDPKNLKENRHSEITWWPASYGSIPETVRQVANRLGFNPNGGQVIQWTTFLGWLLGISFWIWFFKLVCPARFLPWICLTFLSARYSHANFYLYDGGEFFYWASFPVVLILNYKAITSKQSDHYSAQLSAAAGVATPMLVLLKYSAGLSTIGFGLAWFWLVYSQKVSKRNFVNWCISAGVISGFILWLGLIPAGNPSQVDSSMQWTPMLWIPGAWAFAMTDLGTLLNKFTVDALPHMGSHFDGSEGWLFLPFVLLLWWLLKIKASDEHTYPENIKGGEIYKKLAVGHLIGFSLVLGLLLIRGSAIHLDTRFLRPAAITVMPLTLIPLWRIVSTASTEKVRRVVAAAVLFSLTIIPGLYGLAALGHKTFVRAEYASNLTDADGLRHDLLSRNGNAVDFFTHLSNASTEQDVIYLIEPTMGIPLSGRRLLIEEHAHLRTKEALTSRVYEGTPHGNVLIPIPNQLVLDGRAKAIEQSFSGLNTWRQEAIESQPDWVMLIGSP